jgi:ABC-type Zn uptake system ZnuABC Zn-binding protein ZnuA
MRRHVFALVLFAALAVIPAACGDEGLEASGSGIRVVATTTQIGALARAVAGDDVALTVLLKAGADAHDYEPNPQAVKKIHEARLVLRNGLGLDDWLDATIESAGGDARVVTVTTELATPRRVDERGEPDPHVWHDPENAKSMVAAIVSALAEADPANAAEFERRGNDYRDVLDQADAEIRRMFEQIPAENRKVVTNHDALGYFFARYEIEFAGAVIPSANKDAQPSAKDLANLLDTIRASGARVVLAEAEVDPKVARELARDSGVKIVEGLYADSLGPPGSGAETVDGMLLANARKISEALQ